jgi:O-antigen/teichoic acid export membrane protein
VFFGTSSVVTAMFPIVAQKHQRGEPHGYLLAASLAMVALVSAIIIAAALVIPDLIVRVLFGEAYLSIAPLVWLYAVATMLYALANVVINYRLSAGRGRSSALAVVAGVTQVVGLWLFHSTLREVVLVQIYIMAALFVILLLSEASRLLTERRERRANEV